MSKNSRIIILVGLIVLSGTLGIVFASLSQNLSVETDISIPSSSLAVSFQSANGTTSTTVSDESCATVIQEGTINGTSVEGLEAILRCPGSYIETPLEVINNTDALEVKLSNVDIDLFDFLGALKLKKNDTIISLGEIDQIVNGDPEEVTEEQAALIAMFATDFNIDMTDSEAVSDAMSSFYLALLSSFKLSIFKDDGNTLEEIVVVAVEDSQDFNGEIVDTLASTSGTLAERTEDYVLRFEYLSNSTLTLPENYSVIFDGISVNFLYEQAAWQ